MVGCAPRCLNELAGEIARGSTYPKEAAARMHAERDACAARSGTVAAKRTARAIGGDEQPNASAGRPRFRELLSAKCSVPSAKCSVFSAQC